MPRILFFLFTKVILSKKLYFSCRMEEDQQFALASGFQLRSSAAGILGLTRAEAHARPGAYAARLFYSEPQRLHLRPREQQLLQRALLGETDPEIAHVLGLAPDTVKGRWRTIYERVAEIAPELLPSEAGELRRGSEKRRRLLHYLRHHPEELRPI